MGSLKWGGVQGSPYPPLGISLGTLSEGKKASQVLFLCLCEPPRTELPTPALHPRPQAAIPQTAPWLLLPGKPPPSREIRLHTGWMSRILHRAILNLEFVSSTPVRKEIG